MKGSWRRAERPNNIKPWIEFLSNDSPVVCGTETMYTDTEETGYCRDCGREVKCDPALKFKPKLCILCAPRYQKD